MDSNEIIGVEGGKAVVEMAAAKPNMRSLNLDANSFGEAGCEKIYQLLENAGKSDTNILTHPSNALQTINKS